MDVVPLRLRDTERRRVPVPVWRREETGVVDLRRRRDGSLPSGLGLGSSDESEASAGSEEMMDDIILDVDGVAAPLLASRLEVEMPGDWSLDCDEVSS